MRSIKKYHYVLLTMLAVVFTLLIAVSGSFSAGGKQASAEGVWEESGLKGEYSLNETLSVPERCFVIAGQNIKAETTVRFPDGNSTKNQTIPLNVTGVYTVFYTAVYDGKIYSRTETFRVNEGLYSFSSEKSSAAYGKYQYAQNKSGLLVRLAEGDVMRFNTPIDVENTTLSDILVEVFATPDNKGASDFEQFEFTFTDVANPDIYLTITALQSAENIGYPLTYCLAGGNGQPLEGIEHSKNTVHINNEWGTVGVHSFSLAYNGRYDIPEYTDNYPDNYTLRFSYDAEENATYVNGAFMIKFDSPEYYDTLWNGFQSGKVFLSIKAGNYNSQTANFCIVDVKGMDLTAASSVDTDPPVIVVDNEYETMPAAVCGGSYPVPKANANDLYCGAAELKTAVFFNYDSSNYINVNIEDGRFETAREGDYAIVYEATDRFGNKSKTVLYVKCISDLPMPEISVPDFETELFAGEFLKIPEYTAKSYSGTADVKIVLSVGGGEIDVSEQVLIESFEETKLIFRVTDYIGRTSEKSFEIQVKANPLPVFVDEIELPDVFVSGSEYIFPQYYANDYSGENMVRKETYAEITDSDGTTLVHAGDIFTPTVEKNGETVKVVLKCDEASFELNIPAIVPFVEEDGRPRLHLENYLLQNGVVYEKFTDHIVVTANANDGNWKFAKEILAQNASVKFAGIADKNDFGGLLIDFMDYQNPNYKLSVFVSESAERLTAQSGDSFVALDYGFTSEREITVGYLDGKIVVNALRMQPSEDFNGFPSGKVVVGISFVNAEVGAAAYKLISVGGQTMSNATTDRTAPTIAISGSYGGSYGMNEVVVIPAAAAEDVLDPNIVFTLKVFTPDNEIARDVNGIALNDVDPAKEYKIKLETFGQYLVRYTASDTFNQRTNTINFDYALNVIDGEPPQIEFKAAFSEKAKVGDVLIIPDFEVSDNCSAVENIIVAKYVYTPSGRLISLKGNSNSLKCTEEGIYEFRILVIDEAGNMDLICRKIAVSK